jgi:hypothetical protein
LNSKVIVTMSSKSVTEVLDEDVEPQECQGCGEEMEYWNAKKTETNEGEEALDEDGMIFIAWSVSDCKEAAFFWCENCEILQISHKQCSTPMQLLGHQGFSRDGSVHYRDSKTGMKAALTKPGPIDPKVPRFGTQDLDQTKLRMDEWFACGADGDQRHFWMCPECDKSFSFGVQ